MYTIKSDMCMWLTHCSLCACLVHFDTAPYKNVPFIQKYWCNNFILSYFSWNNIFELVYQLFLCQGTNPHTK